MANTGTNGNPTPGLGDVIDQFIKWFLSLFGVAPKHKQLPPAKKTATKRTARQASRQVPAPTAPRSSGGGGGGFNMGGMGGGSRSGGNMGGGGIQVNGPGRQVAPPLPLPPPPPPPINVQPPKPPKQESGGGGGGKGSGGGGESGPKGDKGDQGEGGSYNVDSEGRSSSQKGYGVQLDNDGNVKYITTPDGEKLYPGDEGYEDARKAAEEKGLIDGSEGDGKPVLLDENGDKVYPGQEGYDSLYQQTQDDISGKGTDQPSGGGVDAEGNPLIEGPTDAWGRSPDDPYYGVPVDTGTAGNGPVDYNPDNGGDTSGDNGGGVDGEGNIAPGDQPGDMGGGDNTGGDLANYDDGGANYDAGNGADTSGDTGGGDTGGDTGNDGGGDGGGDYSGSDGE